MTNMLVKVGYLFGSTSSSLDDVELDSCCSELDLMGFCATKSKSPVLELPLELVVVVATLCEDVS